MTPGLNQKEKKGSTLHNATSDIAFEEGLEMETLLKEHQYQTAWVHVRSSKFAT
jgi:hypothetical protein